MPLQLEDEFNDIIKKARYGLGIDVSMLAETAAVSAGDLAAFDSGKMKPTRDALQRIANALHLDEAALWAIVQDWMPPGVPDVDPYHIETLRFPPMNSNGYIVQGPNIDGVLLVDPGGMPERIISLCEAAGGLAAILLTHTHHDHIEALPEVVAHFPAAPVVVHQRGYQALPCEAHVQLIEGDSKFNIHSMQITILHTPGHSEDGLTFCIDDLAFVGDTLFSGSLGRSGAGPATYNTLLSSARRLLSLPPETRLLPGHGPMTTVDWERIHNPFVSMQVNT